MALPEPKVRYRVDIDIYKEGAEYSSGKGNEVPRLLRRLADAVESEMYESPDLEDGEFVIIDASLHDVTRTLTGYAELIAPENPAYDVWVGLERN